MQKKYKNALICGQRIYLRRLSAKDVNSNYLQWLHDKQVNQFLESRFQKWTLYKLKTYVQRVLGSGENIFLAIIAKDSEKHIGNIKIGPIHTYHNFAEMGIMIGAKEYWGKGVATEAIQKATEYCFNTLDLHKVTAGVYANNIGSIKAFMRSGFVIEGTRVKHFLYNNCYVDSVLLGKIKK